MQDLIQFEDIDMARKKLGLKQISSIQEIKNAYRKLSLKHHPDRAGSKGEEKFNKSAFSYRLLMDYSYKYPISLPGKGLRY